MDLLPLILLIICILLPLIPFGILLGKSIPGTRGRAVGTGALLALAWYTHLGIGFFALFFAGEDMPLFMFLDTLILTLVYSAILIGVGKFVPRGIFKAVPAAILAVVFSLVTWLLKIEFPWMGPAKAPFATEFTIMLFGIWWIAAITSISLSKQKTTF